jgi:hypothetical protein
VQRLDSGWLKQVGVLVFEVGVGLGSRLQRFQGKLISMCKLEWDRERSDVQQPTHKSLSSH